ncbi:putative High mobility group protein 20A [Glarea lozoyensis 74030]|uniref:Putative High mobility group protein 20A n=1 Tax=Glarea lozoyensis (strain ATCC 74030 / MF5533) TaxID=1104152 RepID=H0EGG2_GLAL7|nr:putative High mobility group protein 20A [Glarea lozoyensis 74030]
MSAHPPNAALSDLHISPAHWTRRSEPTLMDQIFEELGIAEYLETFKANGFENWSVVLDITESDFDALGVKLGHRRKLQRKIANSRGLSPDRALASPRNTPAEERTGEEQKSSTSKQDGKDRSGTGGPQGSKRKYRRHPKADENCPERPPSAYVIFSNKMREELKGRNLSFTEIAKLVGENWQNLAPAEKEPYEQQAFSAKERYNGELAEYKKTAKYQEYAQYLVEFKARQANQQQGILTNIDSSGRRRFKETQAGSPTQYGQQWHRK